MTHARTEPRRRTAAGEGRPEIKPTSSRAGTAASGHVIDRALFWVLVAGLAWCPFWFGGNDLIAWGINAIFFPGVALVYELSILVRGERHPVGIPQIGTPAALFGAVVLWILVQNATWTPPAMQHPIWQMAADALEAPVNGGVSVNRDLTTLALLRLITEVTAFWMALQLCRNARRANLLLNAIAIIGAVLSADKKREAEEEWGRATTAILRLP
jgi:hypothetical protein